MSAASRASARAKRSEVRLARTCGRSVYTWSGRGVTRGAASPPLARVSCAVSTPLLASHPRKTWRPLAEGGNRPAAVDASDAARAAACDRCVALLLHARSVLRTARLSSVHAHTRGRESHGMSWTAR